MSSITAEYIAYHAAERPHAVALVNRGRAITYAEFARDLRKVVRAVGGLGLMRGSSVVVAHDDDYIHWLLLLSLEWLGIVTGSMEARGSMAGAPLRSVVDCVFAEPGYPVEDARRHVAITAEWLERALASGEWVERIPADLTPEDPVRIVQSSGTTGRPKRLILLRRMFEARVRQVGAQFELTRHSRYLLTAGFHVGHVYGVATACLRAGATVVADRAADNQAAARSLQRHGITHISLMPIWLKQMLDELPSDFVKPPSLAIHPFGAALSEALRDLALARLAVEVFRHYGCNEASTVIASRAPRSDGFATVWPDTVVEIVDDADRPVPLGTTGYIRLRTPCMVEGYADDAEATRRHFKNGWFYPQDLGVMNELRQLKVIGRRDEMLNIGGGKVSPAELEARVLAHAAVADVAVCSLQNALGIEEAYIAVAVAETAGAEVLRQITAAFRDLPLGKFYVVRLPRIPRNATGKIQRDALKQAVAREIAGRSS